MKLTALVVAERPGLTFEIARRDGRRRLVIATSSPTGLDAIAKDARAAAKALRRAQRDDLLGSRPLRV